MSKLPPSVLDEVEHGASELAHAIKLQQRAALVGFDWDAMPPVLGKVHEELLELEAEINKQAGTERLQDELGDLLFAVSNLARKLQVDPVAALRGTNMKFRRRFGVVERRLAEQGKRPQDVDLAEMDAIWEESKRDER